MGGSLTSACSLQQIKFVVTKAMVMRPTRSEFSTGETNLFLCYVQDNPLSFSRVDRSAPICTSESECSPIGTSEVLSNGTGEVSAPFCMSEAKCFLWYGLSVSSPLHEVLPFIRAERKESSNMGFEFILESRCLPLVHYILLKIFFTRKNVGARQVITIGI